jgi:predicted GIY-YIG superfamily endonuclease
MNSDLEGILQVLLESARINIRVRQEYKKLKRRYDTKYFTYALLLGNGKIYVGETNNIYQRLIEHFTMSASSSLWVREHGPIQRVLEITSNAPEGAEEERTLAYMTMFGWENVRGSGWCRVRMAGPPSRLETYALGEMKHAFVPRKDVDDIVDRVKDLIKDLEEM